jgi:hypothetical protein
VDFRNGLEKPLKRRTAPANHSNCFWFGENKLVKRISGQAKIAECLNCPEGNEVNTK